MAARRSIGLSRWPLLCEIMEFGSVAEPIRYSMLLFGFDVDGQSHSRGQARVDGEPQKISTFVSLASGACFRALEALVRVERACSQSVYSHSASCGGQSVLTQVMPIRCESQRGVGVASWRGPTLLVDPRFRRKEWSESSK